MLSRRDLIQSRQYLRQRQVRALVAHRPDPLDWAGRHSGATVFAGVMLLVIGLAGAAVAGLLFPGGATGWQSCTAIVIERETGTAYACDATRPVLFPTANFASAALLMRTTATVQVSRAALTWPRGELLGLPGAPGDLPPAANYLDGAWSVCALSSMDGGRPARVTVVLPGATPDGATALQKRAVLVSGPDGTRYVIWSGRRYRVRDPGFVLPVLGFSAQDGVPVGDAWIASVPGGTDLAPIDVPGAGGHRAGFAPAPVGRIVTAGGRLYVVRTDGLQEVTPLQSLLVRGLAPAAPAVPVAAADLAAGGILPPLATGGTAPAPAEVPDFARPAGGPICAEMIADQVTLVLDGRLPARADAVAPQHAQGPGGIPLADAVLVEPGHAVYARSLSSPQATGGALVLVTDRGVRHALPSAAVATTLGCPADRPPVGVPAALLERLPAGVALDPDAAKSPVDENFPTTPSR
ncbi:type VII secretion protein EccB [Hamadaea tsunoensis]|uniref:type VII secretion protein EccB n=1 Tax=Hamadaea tsunoensis TaxID=53368 RepID=UPI000402ABB7|nr:type VII secretion protein EccB [Hamadaea tsunoensis]